MLSRIILATAVVFCSTISCSKKGSTTPDPTPTPTGNIVTEITLRNNGGTFNRVELVYQRKTIKNFDENSSGITTIEFRPKAGRSSILGDYIGTSTNLANFRTQDGDTVRLIENGVKTDYITDKWDGLNALIAFSSTPSETQSAAATRFNTFVNSSMPTKKYKQP